jgi:signal transduction histidine kinase
MSSNKKLHFKTNAQLKNIIGKNLITDDYVAVLELVKNSFDALSEKVNISFFEVINKDENSNSRIEIQDFGIGMDLDAIENKWLNIAYSEKKDLKSNGGRVFAGNKGVGRFSCDRLGTKLDIYTRTNKNDQIINLRIDWAMFEEANQEDQIQNVDIDMSFLANDDFKRITGNKLFNNGTLLVLSELRSEWDSKKLLQLRKNLEKLINPNQIYNKSKFEININVPELHEKGIPSHLKINGLVENKIFEKLTFKSTIIESKIDDSGKTITTTLNDKGIEVFSLEEKNLEFPLLKNVSLTIFYLNPYAKAYFTKQSGTKAIDFGSIFLFINGFRIPSYGDPGDDWLGIEIRKGQGHSRYLGSREILGRIEIEDKEDSFQIITNRSGLEDNMAYKQLTKSKSPFGFYYKNHRRLERYVVEGLKWDSSKIKEDQLEKLILSDENWSEKKEQYKEDIVIRNRRALNNLIPIINVKKDHVLKLTINESFVNKIIEEGIKKNSAELISFKSALKNKKFNSFELESLSNSLNKKIEDIKKSSSKLDKHSENLTDSNRGKIETSKEVISEFDSLLKEVSDLKNDLKSTEEENQRLEDQLKIEKDKNTYLLSSQRVLSPDAQGLIHNVKITSKKIKQNSERLYKDLQSDNLNIKSGLKRLSTIIYNADKSLKISNLITRANFKTNSNYQDIELISFINQYFDLYKVMYDDQIIFKLEYDEMISFEKRLSILDLSLVIDDLVSNSVKAKATEILIECSKEGDDLILLFSDNGIGVPDIFLRNEKMMFDLGATTTEGSGIGLNFVLKTLEKMNASIKFFGNNMKLSGASFQIIFIKKYI